MRKTLDWNFWIWLALKILEACQGWLQKNGLGSNLYIKNVLNIFIFLMLTRGEESSD